MIAGTVDVGVDDFDLGAAQHGAERRARRGAEVQIAGDQRLSRDAAAGADHFHRQSFFAVIALFDGDELIHVAAGDGGDGEADFFFRGGRDGCKPQHGNACADA